MTPLGQISTHSKQRIQRLSTSEGRPGAGRSAWVGHVKTQAPHAVHSDPIASVVVVVSTVITAQTGIRVASP